MVNSGSFDEHGSEGELAKAEFTKLEEDVTVTVPRTAASPHHLVGACATEANFTAVVPDGETRCSSHDTSTSSTLETEKETHHQDLPMPERDDGLKETITSYLDLQLVAENKSILDPLTENNTQCCEDETKTSLQCSVPLDKVKNVLELCKRNSDKTNFYILENYLMQNIKPSESIKSPEMTTNTAEIVELPNESSFQKPAMKRLLCLFCERTFTSNNLRQKHVDRCHSVGQSRRSSSRIPNQNQSATACCFCSKLNHTDHTLKQLLEHLINEHSNRYFACHSCQERFANLNSLREHNKLVHGIVYELENKLSATIVTNYTVTRDSESVLPCTQTELIRTVNDVIAKCDSTQSTSSIHANSSPNVLTKLRRNTTTTRNNTPPETSKNETSSQSEGVDFEDNILANVISPRSIEKSIEEEGDLENLNLFTRRTKTSVAVTNSNKKSTSKKATVINKKISVKSTKNGVRSNLRTTRATVKQLNTFTKNRNNKSKLMQSDSGGAQIVATKKPVSNPTSVFSLVNAYTYKYEKIHDHSSDSLKDSNSVAFNAVFDKEFYTRTVCNIRDNLLHHLDGKLHSNVESESRISNFEHNPTCVPDTDVRTINDTLDNFGCDLSLNAVTPVATLLASSQYGEDFDSQIEYGAKASQKKAKKAAVVKYKFTNKKYNSLFREKDCHTDLTYLDMWTQFTVKNSQHKCHDCEPFDQHSILPIYSLNPIAKDQVDELNRIMDKRGPFEDLRMEADAAQRFELRKKSKETDSSSDESSKEVYFVLEELLSNVERKCNEIAKMGTTDPDSESFLDNLMLRRVESNPKQEFNQSMEIPDYLQLHRSFSKPDFIPIDETDKIALICSSLDDNSIPVSKALELSGEWTRPRLYICATCGLKLPNLKALDDHKNFDHPHIWGTHYEFVGNQAKLYRHLGIPGLGKVGLVECSPMNKYWQRSDARVCTKCTKQCHSLGDLHRHMLECGGDWTWMLARKKCKYRPYGARSRRRRQRGYKRSCNPEIPREPRKYKTKNTFIGPRPKPTKPSDAETIERMLANLPPKRNRKAISMRDGIQKPRKPYKQRLVSQTIPNNPKTDPAPSASPKKVHFKTSSPHITTKQSLRNALKQKISVLKKPNTNQTEHLETSLKLRSRMNKKNETENNVNKKETEQLIGKNKIRQSRMISRILGSKIFDTNSAIVTRRRLVQAITQNNLIRKTRLRSKIIETNAQLSSDQKSNEQTDPEKLAIVKNKSTPTDNIKKGRNSLRKQNAEESDKIIKFETIGVKTSDPENKTIKRSSSKRFLSVLTKSNKKSKNITEDKKEENFTEKKIDTINATIDDVVKMCGSEIKNTETSDISDMATNNKIIIRKTRSLDRINIDETQENTEPTKIVDDIVINNKKSNNVSKMIGRQTNKLVQNLKSLSRRNKPNHIENENKDNNSIASKLLRTFSMRGSKRKKTVKNNESKEGSPAIDDATKLESLNKIDNIISSVIQNTATEVEVTENKPIESNSVLKPNEIINNAQTMPVLEKFDLTSNIPADIIPDLSPIPVIETDIKREDIEKETDAISDPEINNTEVADVNLNDTDNNKLPNDTLNKFKSKIKRSGRGLNDCIAMLRCKLEQKCQNSEPSLVDKSSLFILNSSEVIKHSQPVEAEQNESVLSNSVESTTENSVTVKEMNKLSDTTNADNSEEKKHNIDATTMNNEIEKCPEVSKVETPSLINVNVLEIPTVKYRNSIINNVATQKMQESNSISVTANNEYLTPNIQLSYVLNATLKNCLMECVKNKCEELKVETQNDTFEKLNRINKDRKIGSIRKRTKKKIKHLIENTIETDKHIGNAHNIIKTENHILNINNITNISEKPVVTEKHIPNVPVLLNIAFMETPIEPDIPITKQIMEESSDEDVPLSKLIGPIALPPTTKLNVKLPVAKKKRNPKKKIAFTPLILNNQETCVPQINLQENLDKLDNSMNNKMKQQLQEALATLKNNLIEQASKEIETRPETYVSMCENELLSNNYITKEQTNAEVASEDKKVTHNLKEIDNTVCENKHIEENLENIETNHTDNIVCEDKIIEENLEKIETSITVCDIQSDNKISEEENNVKVAAIKDNKIEEILIRIESCRSDIEASVDVCEDKLLLDTKMSEDVSETLRISVVTKSKRKSKKVKISEKEIDNISAVINEVVNMFNTTDEVPLSNLEETSTKEGNSGEIEKLDEDTDDLNNEILKEVITVEPTIPVEELTSSVIPLVFEEHKKVDKEGIQESISATENVMKDIIEVFNPLSHHIMTIEDEPCDIHLLNKTLTEANIEPTIACKTVENSEILNKTAHVDSGKENSEEKSLYQRIKKQRKTTKKHKNKRKSRSVKIAISQIENVQPSNSKAEEQFDESCKLSSEMINDEPVNNFKCHLLTAAEPESTVMENKEIHDSSIESHENSEIKSLEQSIVSSDSEDELPLALLIKQRNQNVDIEPIEVCNEIENDNIDVNTDNVHVISEEITSQTDNYNNIEPIDGAVPNYVDLMGTELNEFDDIAQDNNLMAKSLSEENLSLNVEEILTRIDMSNLNYLKEDNLDIIKKSADSLSIINTSEETKEISNLEETTEMNENLDISTEQNEDQFAKSEIETNSEAQEETFAEDTRYQENLMKTPDPAQNTNEEPFDFLKTPINKPVIKNNSYFITTPDLADTSLVLKIEKTLKVKYRKSKKSRRRVIPRSLNKNNIRRKEEDPNPVHICDICNKTFKRKENLTSHKRTLTHIAKLSEIEALECSAKRSAEAAEQVIEYSAVQEPSSDINISDVEPLIEPNLRTKEDDIDLNDIEKASIEELVIHNSELLQEELEIPDKSEDIEVEKPEESNVDTDIHNNSEISIDDSEIHYLEATKKVTKIEDCTVISNENEDLYMEDEKQQPIEIPSLIIDDESSRDSDHHLESENLIIDEEEDIEEIVMNSVPNLVPGIIVNSTNRNLKLVDIINEVLDKPVMDLSIRKIEYHHNRSPNKNDTIDIVEPKRYKSLGERKSFDSDNVSLPHKPEEEIPVLDNYNPINLVVNNGILSKQLSILENIMEETNKINYIDDSISISSREFDEPLVEQTMPEKDIFRSTDYTAKLKDPTIKFSHNSDVLNSFIKPNFTNFQNISETIKKSGKHEEVQLYREEQHLQINKSSKENSTRKILNRDEELFLECCSLLKSSSEITGMSKKKHIPLNNFSQSNDTNWMQKQAVSNRYIQRDSYSWLAQSSRVDTPIGEPFVNNDWSNSNSAVSSEWMAQKAQSPDRPTENNTFLKKTNNNSGEMKYSDIQFEDISVDSSMEASKTLMAADTSNTENIPLDFHNVDFFDSNNDKQEDDFQNTKTDDEDEPQLEIVLDEDSENISFKNDTNEFTRVKEELQVEEKVDVDLKKKVITAFGGLMAKAMGNRLHAVVKRSKRSRSKRESVAQQSSIIGYTVPLKKNKLDPVDSDSSDGPKKIITKGAMKVFEGLKVSIPTQDLNLQEVLNVAKKLDVNEIDSKSIQLVDNHGEELQSQTVKEKSQNHKNGKLKKLFGQFGNKLGLRATKKKQSKHRSSLKAKQHSAIEKSHDVYDFEDSCDNFTYNNGTFPLFRSSRDNTSEKPDGIFGDPKCTTNKKNGTKSPFEIDNIVESSKWHVESDSDTDRYYDSLSFEEISVSSDTVHECNNKIRSAVKINSEKSKENQKKCMIMGRIFKNASKPKLEDKIPEIRDFSSEENSKQVEPYLDSCSSIDNTQIPPQPNNVTVMNNTNKMSKMDMDLLFDKLLESEKKISEAKLAANINNASVEEPALGHSMIDKSHLETFKKYKDIKVKSSKTKKRHRHNSDESRSSDEYILHGRHSKSSKKHHKTPRKPSKPKKESGFNLEQEMKECIGVAGRKSQRKCTSGKQNVLIESWSSDESSFEDEISPVVVETEHIPQNEEDSNTGQIDTLSNSCNSVSLEILQPVVSEEKNLNFDVYDFDSDMETKSVEPPKTTDIHEFINVNKIKIPKRSAKSKMARSRKHSKTHLALNEIEYDNEKSKKRAEHRRRRMLAHAMSESKITDSLAVTRKKRNASDMLYYWSSSSDDEFQDLIEVKPIREDTDDDRPMQHGWIVGESPKKLVTLLAQAKGKKIEGESVKEQGKKNRVTL